MKRLSNLGHVVLLCLASTAFVSCDDFNGTFKAEKELTLIHYRNLIFKTKKDPKTFKAGEYSAKLKIESSTEVELHLGKLGKDPEEDGRRVSIKLPKDSRLEDRDMSVLISAADLGQNYNMQVDVESVTEVSEDLKYGTDTCSVRLKERVCHMVEDKKCMEDQKKSSNKQPQRVVATDNKKDNDAKKPQTGNNNPKQCKKVKKCGMEWVTRYGKEDIEYRLATTTKYIDLKVIEPEDNLTIGSFSSNKVVKEAKVDVKSLSKCKIRK